jgi:hypothetical protein
MPGTWFPGQLAAGAKVFNSPVVINGITTLQKGLVTFPPTVTAPGTIASTGTVYNTTGYDVNVYMSATTTLNTVKINGVTIPGSLGAGQTGDYYVPAGASLVLTYTGGGFQAATGAGLD